MTYSDSIPRYTTGELGIEGFPQADDRSHHETRFFGWVKVFGSLEDYHFRKVTVKGLPLRYFEEQISTYHEMSERERLEHVEQVTRIRHKEREVRFATEVGEVRKMKRRKCQIQHHPHVMKTCCFVRHPSSVQSSDGDDIRAIVMEYAPGGTVEECGAICRRETEKGFRSGQPRIEQWSSLSMGPSIGPDYGLLPRGLRHYAQGHQTG